MFEEKRKGCYLGSGRQTNDDLTPGRNYQHSLGYSITSEKILTGGSDRGKKESSKKRRSWGVRRANYKMEGIHGCLENCR